MTDETDQIVWVGDRVRKITGYKFEGVVVAAFSNTQGQARMVVEHDDGWLFIFTPDAMEKVPPKVCDIYVPHGPHGLCPGVQR